MAVKSTLFVQLMAALLLASAVSSFSARNWQTSDSGLTRWDTNCDFNGHDIKMLRSISQAEQCEGECIANPSCTHFTQSEDNCFLKRNAEKVFFENHNDGSVCGFIRDRISGQ